MLLDILVSSWTVLVLLALFVPHFPGWLEWSREHHHLALSGFSGVWLLSWVPSVFIPSWGWMDVVILAFASAIPAAVLVAALFAKEKERQDSINTAASRGIGIDKLVMPKSWSSKKRMYVWFACWGGGVLTAIFLGDYILNWPLFTFGATILIIVASWLAAAKSWPKRKK